MTAESEEEDSDEWAFMVEEIGSVKAKGKHVFAKLQFMDCQLDTGATCNVMSHRDL
jgi:hypothetical protein